MNTNIMDSEIGEEQVQNDSGPAWRTEKVACRQNGIQGGNKEVSIEGYSDVAKLGQLLKDLDYPAQKSKILRCIIQTEDFQNKGFILKALNDLEKKSYYSLSDIAATAGLVINLLKRL